MKHKNESEMGIVARILITMKFTFEKLEIRKFQRFFNGKENTHKQASQGHIF